MQFGINCTVTIGTNVWKKKSLLYVVYQPQIQQQFCYTTTKPLEQSLQMAYVYDNQLLYILKAHWLNKCIPVCWCNDDMHAQR